MDSTTFLSGLTLPQAPVPIDPTSLYTALTQVQDGRKRRGRRYSLALVLTLIILAKLAGETKMSGIAHWARLRTDWLTEVFQLPRKRLPCLNTYILVSDKVQLAELNAILTQFFVPEVPPAPMPEVPSPDVSARGRRHLALDGKSLRGTRRARQPRQPAVHLLGLYDVSHQGMVAQVQVATKDHEVRCAAQLLAGRDLRGCVLTADALHTQRHWCSQVQAQGGDYILLAKKNQPGLLEDIAFLFDGVWPAWLEQQEAQTVDKGHGRIEVRHLRASTELNEYLGGQWTGLAQVFQIEREITRAGAVTQEVVCGISSLPVQSAAPDRMLALVRAHWHLENRVHWRRDVTLGEDASQIRRGQAPQVVAALNNAVLSLMDRHRVGNVPAQMREFAANPGAALALLIGAA